VAPKVLAVDVGGTHVKARTQEVEEPLRFKSGPALKPGEMVERVKERAADLDYEVVSVGVPAPVRAGRIVHDPVNLGKGWAGFDFEAAFGKPTKVANDAAMQAIGSYEGGGRMLFLGLGTGLGSAMVVDGVVEAMELAHLPYRKKTYEDYVNTAALERAGRQKWQNVVFEVVELFVAALAPDYVVLGGGNAKELTELPEGARLGANENAFAGGFRMWE
jgi:predicted NBD/HSP70 family sugar kinase